MPRQERLDGQGSGDCSMVDSDAKNFHERILSETFFIDALDPGIRLHVRNKRPGEINCFPPEAIVLFVHGATYPCETIFDIDLPGGSWMDCLAHRGFDAYFVDVRGYGRSTRPPAMLAPADQNPPFADTDEAVRDVSAAVDFILKRRNVDRVNLVGWSWGTAIMGGYTVANNDRVNKLVLCGPLWVPREPPPFSGLGAYRAVDREQARLRMLRSIPSEWREEISPSSWFDRWWAANLATDPEGAALDPPALRAPNGVVKDMTECWEKGKPTWDPSALRVPTLLVLGEWDQDTPLHMAQEVFARLGSAPDRRLLILSQGSHMYGVEKNRMRLIRQVQHFLEEPH